jgi:hypothetical protein
MTSFCHKCTNTSNVPHSPPFGIMTQVKLSVILPVTAWHADRTRFITNSSVSFEQFIVAFKLSVNCSSGFVRRNWAGNFEKTCFSTSESFSISDYFLFFNKPWRRLPVLTLGEQKVNFAIYVPFWPHSHTFSQNSLLPYSASSSQTVSCLSCLVMNNQQFNSYVSSVCLNITVDSDIFVCCPSSPPSDSQFVLCFLGLTKFITYILCS